MINKLTIFSDSEETISHIQSALGTDEFEYSFLNIQLLSVDKLNSTESDMLIIDTDDNSVDHILELLNKLDLNSLPFVISFILEDRFIPLFKCFFISFKVHFFIRPIRDSEFYIRILKYLYLYNEDQKILDNQKQLNWNLNNQSSRLDTALEIAGYQSNLLDLMLNSIHSGIIAVDPSDTVVMMNKRSEKIFNTSCSKSIGRSLWDIVSSELHHYIANILSLSDTTNPFGNVYTLKHPDGTICYLNISVKDFLDNDKNINGKIIIFDDVTSKVDAYRLRNSFSTIVSHELKTPLTVINNCIDLLKMTDVSKAQSQIIDDITEATERSNELVSNILHIIYLNGINIHPLYRKLYFSELSDKIFSDFQQKIIHKGINVIKNKFIEESFFFTDMSLIMMILSNVIDNAIKYNRTDGNLFFTISKVDNQICFTIKDEGNGINPETADSLFQCFLQGENNMTRIHSGMGVGLYIAKKATELINGKLSFTSSIGEGSTFAIYIPFVNISDIC